MLISQCFEAVGLVMESMVMQQFPKVSCLLAISRAWSHSGKIGLLNNKCECSIDVEFVRK